MTEVLRIYANIISLFFFGFLKYNINRCTIMLLLYGRKRYKSYESNEYF